MASVVGLRCARVCIILVVILGMTNPKSIGSKSAQRNGIMTFTFSAKRWINILRRVNLRRLVWYNWSVYFYNA